MLEFPASDSSSILLCSLSVARVTRSPEEGGGGGEPEVERVRVNLEGEGDGAPVHMLCEPGEMSPKQNWELAEVERLVVGVVPPPRTGLG